MYLNPGAEAFAEAVNSSIFVDKTPMISFLNTLVKTKQKYVGVFRPRRFGKTTAADMICAYYSNGVDTKPFFADRKLSMCKGWDQYINQFDVIRIVMTDIFRRRA